MGEPEEENPEETAAEETAEEQTSEESAQENSEEQKPFSALDLREAYVFGWEKNPTKKCWYNLSLQARALGWDKANIQQLESSLKTNVEACYFHLASLYFIDLEDDTRYHAWFDTMKMLWGLEIEDSPKAELEIQQIGDFFKSDIVKKCISRCAELITRAAKEFDENLRVQLEEGRMLAVDEVKLAAILDAVSKDITMKSFREGKWMNS